MCEQCHSCNDKPADYRIKLIRLSDGKQREVIEVCLECLRREFGFTNIYS